MRASSRSRDSNLLRVRERCRKSIIQLQYLSRARRLLIFDGIKREKSRENFSLVTCDSYEFSFATIILTFIILCRLNETYII